ncbi:hypothetical protein AMEX_G5725 [Astyanax mexicanus]|uniref:Uncharacterized protein n=1 Tax=Astyanax mexicanus TaxID=7994 RepID=A0A8T2MA43_ASTMX|nr:hypothetical protein AMEX_G5725 [Astyanax mexicanus]
MHCSTVLLIHCFTVLVFIGSSVLIIRNILIFCALTVLLTEADLDAGKHTFHTPAADQLTLITWAAVWLYGGISVMSFMFIFTESMNSPVSPDQPNENPMLLVVVFVSDVCERAVAGCVVYIFYIVYMLRMRDCEFSSSENESPESEEAVKAAPVQRNTKSNNPAPRKRSKPVAASKKRTRSFRP